MVNKIIKILLTTIILIIFFLTLFFLFASDTKLNFISKNFSEIVKYTFENTFEEANRKIDILEYDLKLNVFHQANRIKENAKIKLVAANKGLSEIELDFYDNFKINFVKLNDTMAKYEYDNNKIIIFRNNNFVVDTLLVEIDFEGEPQNLGMGSFAMEQKNGKHFISTLNEPIYASTWFPCNDTPTDKATTKISITNDSNIVSLSNGKLANVITTGERRTYIWESQYPIATYLISIYSGEYKHFREMYYSENDSMHIDYYVMEENIKNAKNDFANHPKYLKVFSKMFGEYPFIKDKYGVAEILWQLGAMESQTITGFGGVFISGMNFNESILIHELAHNWWGNSVTIKSWKDIWLSEGFARYAEALYYEKTTGIKSLISTMHSFKQNINISDNHTLYNPGINLFTSNIYNKGAWVLHMLRKEIGDSLFFNGLKSYYNKYKYGNVDTEDFQKYFETISNKNLDKFFSQWVYDGKRIIELEIETSEKIISKDSISIEIKIEQTQSGYDNYHFPLDIELDDSSGNIYKYSVYIKSDTTLHYTLKDRIENAFFDKENWLLANFNNFTK